MSASGISPYKQALTKPANVRVALPSDAPALYELLLKLYKDNPLGISMSPAKVMSLVENVCMGSGGVAGVIDGPNGDLVASVGITAFQPWFSEEYHLVQLWLFVDPAHRVGGRNAKSLFEFAKWHKDDLSRRAQRHFGIESSFMSLIDQPQKARLWNRHGRMVGMTFWTD
jgi:hypothetical protein